MTGVPPSRPRSGSRPTVVIASPISTMPPSVASDAPPISIRWVGPQSVTSWPNSRCHMSSSGKPGSANAPQAAIIRPPIGRPPVPAQVDGGRSWGAPCRPAAIDRTPRHEHAVEADQDQVVGGVGKRPRVAAVVDVQRDVPVHAEHGREQRDPEQHRRQRRPGRQPRLALRPVARTREQLHPSAPVPRDQKRDERGCHERPRRGADRLADGGAAGRFLPVDCARAGAASVSTTSMRLPTAIPARLICLAPWSCEPASHGFFPDSPES